MFGNWLKLSTEMAWATMDAQRVIALRLMKLSRGGPAAQREARRMFAEKVTASAEAGAAIASGKSSASVLRRYRTLMRANERRLSGKR